MGEQDHSGVMAGRLHLDPEFAPPEPEPDTHFLAPTTLPPLPETPAPQGGHVDMDMGIGADGKRKTGGSPAWLDGTKAGPVFDHYSQDEDLSKQLDRKLELPKDLIPKDDGNPAPRGWHKNDAGLGRTTKNWQIGGKPTMSTSDRFDNPDSRDRADRQDRDEADAKARRETVPDPIGDELEGK